MKKTFDLIAIWTFIILIVFTVSRPAEVSAAHGDSGFEGGISSGEMAGKTVLDYQEVCFITGQPIVFKGTLSIRKSSRQDTVSTTYTYNLKNEKMGATLNRSCSYSTKSVEKDNGQTLEDTTLSRIPSETIRINDTTYVLRNNDFSYTSIVEHKPSIDYRAGDILAKKTYQLGTGSGSGYITVEVMGSSYGYNQHWGTAETMVLDYIIHSQINNGEVDDEWSGTAKVSFSTTSIKENRFVENEPYEISFDGGYVESQFNSSILEYRSKLPEFDSQGISTYYVLDSKGSLELETFPVQTRFMVPNLGYLRGHWAEEYIKELFSMEIFKNTENAFDPEKHISRAEFISAVVHAGKTVPVDPSLITKSSRKPVSKSKNKKEEIISPFIDVSIEDPFFEDIKTAYDRGIIGENLEDRFYPQDSIILGDALTIFIKSLGLESLAPAPNAVTIFKDNDLIPPNARSSVYIAQRIGLIQGDERGYLRPTEKLTNGRASALINRLIDYMRVGIRKDYRERIVDFN